MASCSKKIEVKLELFIGIDTKMVEKSIRRELCHATYWYAKANNKYMNDHDKNKE